MTPLKKARLERALVLGLVGTAGVITYVVAVAWLIVALRGAF